MAPKGPSRKKPAAKKRPLGSWATKSSVRPKARPQELAIHPAAGKPILITDVALRDGHQSLLATRMRTEDMLPIAQKLDAVGFWSLEVWGGATFDTCLRFLKEDPWERLRALRAAMPNTKLQMLLRGQNLVGYRHYADDVLERFVERSAANGIDAAMKKYQLDALLFPGPGSAAIAAKPGYPTVIVPFGLVPNAPQAPAPPFPEGFAAKPTPYGVGFTGLACSEPRLIELAYAFEQATRRRVPPSSAP